MFDGRDLDAAERLVDDWAAGIEARPAQARELSTRLAQLSARQRYTFDTPQMLRPMIQLVGDVHCGLLMGVHARKGFSGFITRDCGLGAEVTEI